MITPPPSLSLRGRDSARSNPPLQRDPCLTARFSPRSQRERGWG